MSLESLGATAIARGSMHPESQIALDLEQIYLVLFRLYSPIGGPGGGGGGGIFIIGGGGGGPTLGWAGGGGTGFGVALFSTGFLAGVAFSVALLIETTVSLLGVGADSVAIDCCCFLRMGLSFLIGAGSGGSTPFDCGLIGFSTGGATFFSMGF